VTPSPYLTRKDKRDAAGALAAQPGWATWSDARNAPEHAVTETAASLLPPQFEGPVYSSAFTDGDVT